MNSNNENSTTLTDQSKLSAWKKRFHFYDEWFKKQGRKRCWIFTSGTAVFAVILGCWYFYVKHHVETHTPATCIGSITATALFLIAWSLICFRFRNADFASRKIETPKLMLWWVTTIWLSLFVAVAGHAQTSTSANTNNTALIQKVSAIQTSDSPAQNPAKPALVECSLIAWIIATIIVLAIVTYIILAICYAAGVCGQHGNQPPQSPPNNGNGDNGNIVFINGHAVLKANANISAAISTNLPVTIFYLVNGQIVSNSAGYAMTVLPSMFSLGGLPITNETLISSTTPGLTTPPSIAVWIETNTFSDSVLDPTHPYAVILNYSVLGSTNLPDWKEVYTAISWVNNNPRVPLVASIYYTNGVPETTNWSQLYLDSHRQPTNIVVYGALFSVGTNSNQSAIKHADAGLPLPGGTPISSAQFYKLVANTNDIVTGWP